jgi:hypothetical protein
MDSGSNDKALERIEAALARIENAATQQKSDSDELRSRHEKLKTATSRSLGQLDELIAGQRK